jgi:hypothetical protein
MLRRFLPFCLLPSLFFLPSLRAETASEFVHALYQNPDGARFYFNEGSLKLYSPEIQELLKKAMAQDRAHAARHPDEKPPFAEASLLLPGPDAYAATRFYSLESAAKDHTTVIVEFLYPPKDRVPSAFLLLDLSASKAQWHIAGIRRLASPTGASDPVAELKKELQRDSEAKP